MWFAGIKFSATAAIICFVQAGFYNNSFNKVIAGCVGANIGSLVVIKCPFVKASDMNHSSYYSGHHILHEKKLKLK